jgi:hypothetical protein
MLPPSINSLNAIIEAVYTFQHRVGVRVFGKKGCIVPSQGFGRECSEGVRKHARSGPHCSEIRKGVSAFVQFINATIACSSYFLLFPVSTSISRRFCLN